MKRYIIMAVLIAVVVWAFTPPGATNFDRIVLGEGNFGSDPNATADITLQNDEYISNSSDDTVSISGVLSTNNITAAYLTATGLNLDSGVTVGQDVLLLQQKQIQSLFPALQLLIYISLQGTLLLQ